MKFTRAWVEDHLHLTVPFSAVVEKLPHLGFPVETVEDWGQTLGCFKVVEVKEVAPHPFADKLKVCQVWTGTQTLQIVCGAPNVRAGMKTVLALPGTLMPTSGHVIKSTTLRQVDSHGMLCSLEELGLGLYTHLSREDGLLVLPASTALETSVPQALSMDDIMVDIEVTPNRGDMLGVHGIARELAAAGLGILKSPPPLPCEGLFPRFALACMTLPQGAQTPAWMAARLVAIGQTPRTLPVDVSNYLTFDGPRPLHMYDYDALQGRVRLKRASGGELFAALDGKTYTLPRGAWVVVDDAGILALGGIIGGARGACSPSTQRVVVESAFFPPEDIARTGQALGIHTQARARFERGVDPTSVTPGLAKALALMGGGDCDPSQLPWTPAKLTDLSVDALSLNDLSLEDVLVTAPTLTLPLPLIHQISGMDIPSDDVVQLLTRLGCTLSWEPQNGPRDGPGEDGEDARNNLLVIPPSWRPDLNAAHDLVEEVVRLTGYDHLPSVPLPLGPLACGLPFEEKQESIARKVLASRGLYEVITWSFMGPDKANLWGQDLVVLDNPLSREWSVMRPSLLPNLLDLALQHQNRSLVWKGFFEVGPQYGLAHPPANTPSQTQRILGLLNTVIPAHWGGEPRVDLFTAKSHCLEVLETLGVRPDSLRTTMPAGTGYHPGRSGLLMVGNRCVGAFGDIHPAFLAPWGLKDPLVAFEIFLENLQPPRAPFPRSSLTLSSYQPVPLDVAFIVGEKVSAEDLVRTLKRAAGPELQSLAIFDVFRDDTKIGVHKKSLAFRLVFQSHTHTLDDAFMGAKLQEITQACATQWGAQLRDGGDV